jgi:cytoskeletal protein RodZ
MTAIFETKKVNMETLPEYLKDARVSFSYDLHHVGKITNISEKFLESLEEGAYHKLPADVYVYGFLRKLAELYRSDPDILIEQYKKERGIHDQLNRTPVYKSYKEPKLTITPKTITLAAVVLFILFVLGYLIFQVNALNRPPFIKIAEPADGARITSSSLLVQGQTTPGTNLRINEQQVFVDSEGNFKQPVSISPGEKILKFVATNNFGKESTKQIVIYGDFQTQEEVDGEKDKAPLELIIEINPNSTWLVVKVDDEAPKNETFIAGSSKTYAAKSQILISTGDAGSTKITFNGHNLGKLGRDGEVLRDIPFTVDSINIK